MRVLLLANNWVGWKVAEFLHVHKDAEIIGAVVHPETKAKYRSEILETLHLPDSHIFDGSTLQEKDVLTAIRALKPDIGVSALFDYILKKEFLELFPGGCVNVHPAYLPYNRGSYPNVFSIIEGTPAGATVHFMSDRIDEGDIVAQKEVPVDSTDTGETLYHKLEHTCVDLFRTTWPKIVAGIIERIPQNSQEGTLHQYKDVDVFDHVDLHKSYNAKHLIAVLRARTFPPYKGAYFIDEQGEKVYIRVQLLRENEL